MQQTIIPCKMHGHLTELPCYASGCPYFEDCLSEAKKTNADRIRSMSDEELAKLLLDGCRGSECDKQPHNEYGSVNCFQCRMDWLHQSTEAKQ